MFETWRLYEWDVTFSPYLLFLRAQGTISLSAETPRCARNNAPEMANAGDDTTAMTRPVVLSVPTRGFGKAFFGIKRVEVRRGGFKRGCFFSLLDVVRLQ